MTGRWYLLFGILLFMLISVAGCISLSVGDVTYSNSSLLIGITGPATPQESVVQVTVYEVDEFSQHEVLTTWTTVTPDGSERTVGVPADLGPGRYKIYVYLTRDGERETAVIRDITV